MSQTKVVKVEEVEKRLNSGILGQRSTSQDKFNAAVREAEGEYLQ